MMATGDDEFDVINIEETVFNQVAGHIIEVDDKSYRAYDRALVAIWKSVLLMPTLKVC